MLEVRCCRVPYPLAKIHKLKLEGFHMVTKAKHECVVGFTHDRNRSWTTRLLLHRGYFVIEVSGKKRLPVNVEPF
jgi:hypothetical protein